MNTFSASQLSFPYEKAVLYNFRNLNDHLVQPPDFIGAEREVQKRHVTCPWLQGKCGARFQGLGCIVHALLSTSSGSCSLWFLILLCSPQHCPNLTLQSMVVSKPLCLFFFFFHSSDYSCHSHCFASRNSRLSDFGCTRLVTHPQHCLSCVILWPSVSLFF